MTLFFAALSLSMTKLYNIASVRRFIFPLQLSTILSSMILMSLTPIHRETLNVLVISATLLMLNIALIIKTDRYKLYFIRILDPLLQTIIVITALYALETNFNVRTFSYPVVAVTLLIPSTIQLIEYIISDQPKKTNFLLFNILTLLTTAIILSLGIPVINLAITTYALLNILMIISLSKESFFGIIFTAHLLLITTALMRLLSLEGVELLIVTTVMLTVLANLWRVPLMFKINKKDLNNLLRVIKRTAILTVLPLMIFSLLTIQYKDHLILLQYLTLTILFLTAPIKGSKLRLLAGIGPTLAFWHMINISDTPKYANAQLYAFPMVLMAMIASCRSNVPAKTKKKAQKDSLLERIFSFITLLFAITLPLNIALIQSLFDPEPFNIYQSILLVTISIVLLIFGSIKKHLLLKIVSIVYLITGSIILLWRFSSVIPWWIYLAILGLLFILLSFRTIVGITEEVSQK